MAVPATRRTIGLPLLLLVAVLLPSQASEYRSQPYNNPRYGYTPSYDGYTPSNDEYTPSDDGYMPSLPIPSYKAGKPLKRSYQDQSPYSTPSYPSSSLAYLFLAGQNAARAAVGLPPFVWDDQLAAYAQNWANQRVNDCALIHSGGPYGENIFWGSGDNWSPKAAVDSWVVERENYDYSSNSCSGGEDCGHYTQIIWRDSTRIGCAKVTCNGGAGVFMTCNYDPPGNYLGSRPY